DLLPGRVGEPELFAILGAGYARQRVFLSEIASVGALLESDFSARDRVIHLANSSAEPMRFPLMNATNLSEALSATAEAMNSGEDLALLFLTSHGHTDVFSTQFAGISYKDVSAPQLADMIDASGIENLIVVVSACYSGSFIDDLAADDRLIITAAGADRKSFGCSDHSEWTWFGEAFFDIALRRTKDFRFAFEDAVKTVAAWETAAGYAPSNPQIQQGSEIAKVIDCWLEARLAQR
ncbi:MAG: C13 family peptidase, partial [Pseudomonadota bacterium]